jgi:hypothetical protein
MTLMEVMIALGIVVVIATIGWASVRDAIALNDALAINDDTTRIGAGVDGPAPAGAAAGLPDAPPVWAIPWGRLGRGQPERAARAGLWGAAQQPVVTG